MADDDFENDYILLLICKTCKSVEELPYVKTGKYLSEGKYDQEFNPFLEGATRVHNAKGCERGLLADVKTGYWMTPKVKASIVEQIQKQFTGKSALTEGLDAFGTNFYGLKDTFSADAMSCWRVHNSPKGQCDDYKTDRKKLDPGTSKDRSAAGIAQSTITVHLCDFCPVKMYNQKKAYEAKGLYK